MKQTLVTVWNGRDVSLWDAYESGGEGAAERGRVEPMPGLVLPALWETPVLITCRGREVFPTAWVECGRDVR